MPRELITIQVGQCGNQIGCRFWELALREHAAAARAAGGAPRYDDALSTFFRNVDSRVEPPLDLPVGDGRGPLRTLKARAVLVDMEESVVSGLLGGPLGDIFDARQLLTDVSGAGNNWAHGHYLYGPQYREQLLETVRRPAEACESLQAFLLLHSLGGGTGSGLGTYLLQELADEFPEVYRFSCAVFPSEDDDVVTSPYNSVLAAAGLAEHADCVFPVENQALMDICGRIDASAKRTPVKAGTSVAGSDPGAAGGGRGGRPFDAMNGVVANMLLNLTASVRFDGALNVDVNDLSMNLVPFPRMHFLLSSLAPLAAPADLARMAATPRAIDGAFTDLFSRENQLIKADPRRSAYLACGLLLRGPVSLADVGRNIARLRSGIRMAHWNPEGFKLGLCDSPPVGLPFSALALANNCCFGGALATMRERFDRLYRRGVYVHHYTQYMEQAVFDGATHILDDLIAEYATQDAARPPPPSARPPRHEPVGLF